MILQALHDLAKLENLANDLDYIELPVPWVIELQDDGTLLNIESRKTFIEETTKAGKTKSKLIAQNAKIPTQIKRTVGINPNFFVDNCQYVFGILHPTKKSKKAERVKDCLIAFRDMVKDCADVTNDVGALAVLTFLNNIINDTIKIEWNDDWSPGDRFMFHLASSPDNTPIHLRPAIMDYWANFREKVIGGDINYTCVITGEPIAKPSLFPALKKLPGGSGTGTSPVSFNAESTESHGWEKNENGPIDPRYGEMCARGWNRLLDSRYPDPDVPGSTLPSRMIRLNDDTSVIYWSSDPDGNDFCDFFPNLINPGSTEVETIYNSVWRGVSPEISNTSALYAMTITGKMGRAIIRDWYETTVNTVLKHITNYFSDINIVNLGFCETLPLYLIIKSLAVNGEVKNLPPNISSEMFNAIIAGRTFSRDILQYAIDRYIMYIVNSDSSQNNHINMQDARAAIIKGYINRKIRHDKIYAKTKKELTPEMDPNNKNPSYLLGRLFALIEDLQEKAHGGRVNTTIADRYMRRAATSPQSAFVPLLKNMNIYFNKLENNNGNRGWSIYFHREIDNILSEFSGESGIPKRLNLDQQGLFIIGYHHQRYEKFRKRNNDANDETDDSSNELETTSNIDPNEMDFNE